MRVVYLGAVVSLCVGIAIAAAFNRGGSAAQQANGPASWRSAGRDADNSRYQPLERKISTANVNQLIPRWTFTTESDVSATPTVEGDAVYFPDWAGNLYAVRARTGDLIWSKKI
ncbi:MAG: PQQ-binding-like beta-propeller repeat protein, partial [Blastocatellia bacterium]|nr:PQQ-binding-like beta-propeller repeat protein [Blastocatellia bacterium]